MSDTDGFFERRDTGGDTQAVLDEPVAPGMIDSTSLLGGSKTVAIRHGAEIYTLRKTRAGKLLLTK
ncbi:MAG: hemin uptake protein HemP [Pseudomonadota bacterium]